MYTTEEPVYVLEDSRPAKGYGLEKIKESPFANILLDTAFKLILGAEENTELLKTMIQALVPGLEIDTIEYPDKEISGFCIDDKKNIFDVYCIDKSGKRFVIEMQYSEQKDFTDRMLFYSTYPIRSQLVSRKKELSASKSGKKIKIKSYRLCPVYMISILNFQLKHNGPDPRRDGLVSTYEIRNNGNGELMTDSLKFVFFELGAFPYKYGELEKCTTFVEKMAYYLLYIGHMKKEPEEEQEEFFLNLLAAAKRANLSQEKLRILDKAMTTSLDIIAQKDFALQQGMQQGIQQGMQQGTANERKANAKAMLEHGIGRSDVCSILGISEKQLDELLG